MSTRILLVDDHLIVRRGLASLLDDEPDLEVVGVAGNGADAIVRFEKLQPTVAILDLRLPDQTGIEAACLIRETDPQARLMILSSYVKEADVRLAFEAGILAYVSKDSDSEDLLHAVREVASGRQYVPMSISGLLAKSTASAQLSVRELEILKLIAKGRANKEIGSMLCVAENTVKNHVKSILTKLDARDRTHAVSEGLKRGLFRLDDE